jgi:hypothetical protein
VGLLDALLGRSKPVKPNLDQLFALSGAAVTLQAATGLVPTGQAGVCAKPPTGPSFAEMQRDIQALLTTAEIPGGSAPVGLDVAAQPDPVQPLPLDDDGSGLALGADTQLRTTTDSFGYSWVVLDGGSMEDLVTRVHMVHSSLSDAGWGPQLLCSVFGFRPGPEADQALAGRRVFLVYLAKRGSFYPFVPTGAQRRDNELELRIRSVLGSDLPFEADLSRWFPLWDLPLR